MHQLTLLLSSRRRQAAQASVASTAKSGKASRKVSVIVPPEEKEPIRRCLNESAHKLYR